MTEYIAHFVAKAFVAVPIEADSPEEAQEKADEFNKFPTLCAQCSGWGRDYGIDLGDFEQDGEVEEQ